MPRRHGSKKSTRTKQPRPLNRQEGIVKRWNKPEDIPMDEEDQFHASRDRILLEGEDLQSDDEGDEDEIFELKGLPDDSDDEDEDNADGDEDEDVQMEDASKASKAKAKTKKSQKSKGKQKDDVPPSSDGSGSESAEEGWGRKKAEYYASNAADLDSEDEEAHEMEELEAKRLQAKSRDALTDEDFGLADRVDVAADADIDLDEPAPSILLQALPQDKISRLRHLEKTNPEALALAGDWEDACRLLLKTQQQISDLENDDKADGISSGMLHLYYQALLTYVTTLSFYLYLRSSEKYAQQPESLRSHPIMSRLLTLKKSLSTLEELGVGESDDEDDDDDSELGSDEDADDNLFQRLRGVPSDELRAILADLEQMSDLDAQHAKIGAQLIKTSHAAAAKISEEPPKKKRKTETSSEPKGKGKEKGEKAIAKDKKEKTKSKAPTPVFDLEEPEFPTKSKPTSRTPQNADTDAFGEFTALQSADAADKAARKRSLKFHTSKIESASARRERARTATGGDDDIPWRDRRRDQDEKQKKALEKSRGQGGADLDDEEPEPREETGKKRRRDEDEDAENDSGSDEDASGYYELVKRKSKEKKEKKKEEYEVSRALEREGMLQDDSAEGPRSVSKAILKNRGLTPHRSKSVRNPRVKKRERYEKAKKKVSSQKAVYKGGLATSGKYEGEKTGISKVIKGVRLS